VRIKRLELTGFKSSKDKTVLEFPDGITGIVGPNGCGKSNIVDALRWVLGEQSARHLRGRSMEDVIFAGNQHYGPLGMAEVTIVLDNEKGIEGSPAELAEEESEVVRALRKVPELQVTRRLYRSGESEYLINDRPCRLRDITELFLGTGVGTKAYSIVEQGRVGQIVGAKPEELRLFIEEAAGTTLYRSRKVAAERKIERTRDNLLRVSDIIRELERQANSLRRQARGAVQYQELRAQEVALDQAWTFLRMQGIEGLLREASEAAAEQSGREHALRMEIARGQQERESLRERGREAESARESARQVLYGARAEMEKTEQERRHLLARRGELESLLAESGNDLALLEERLATLTGEADEAAHRRDELAIRYEEAQAVSATVTARVRECDERYFSWSSDADAMRSRLIEALGASAALRNERASVARQIEAAEARESRLREEEESLAAVRLRLQEELRIADEKVAELASMLDAAEGSKKDAAQMLSAAQVRRAAAQADAERWRDECALLRSRVESLEELHRGFSGYNDGVRAFMSNGGRERAAARAVVADVIEIESGFERAVAAVLGEALQYIVVPTTESGIEGARYLREHAAGRATFLPSNDETGQASRADEGVVGLLSRHVRVREGFEGLLAPLLDRCVVVGDLDEARARWSSGERGFTFVTVDGEVVSRAGIVTGGSENPVDEGLLLRSSELRRIREALENATVHADASQQELRAAVEAAAGMDGRLAELDRELHQLAVDRVRWSGEKRLHEQNSTRTDERGRAVRVELESVQREKAAAEMRQAESEVTLQEKEREATRLEAERAEVEAAGKLLEAARRQALSDLEQARVAEAEARQRIEALASQLAAVALARNEAAGRRESLLARVERSRLEVESVAARMTDPSLDVDRLKKRCEEAESSLKEVDSQAAAARAALEALERDLDGLGKRLDEARAEFGRCELRRTQHELEKATLLEGLAERLGVGAEELASVVVPEGATVSTLAAELDAVRGRIRRLGTVNLGAVAELEEIEARLAELCGQRDDLERSIEDLSATIARLNRLSRQRFHETFDEVNRIFQGTFPKLFPGGKASLSLTDPENLLETGVEIFVQPPGKRLGNLDLLSGGEKAMTAIGLIFALFLHKPSPFCVLDEVDAPLDEANIGRFARIVAEMCERSQFLLITHNKRTMEICDILYGVTMPEPGVSRMVSVDLSQAA
jgi:chromosome segregation protein